MIRKRTKQMAAFLVLYDPSKGKEREMIEALDRWSATRIFRGAWVMEFPPPTSRAGRS
jgi:hypothetical protein